MIASGFIVMEKSKFTIEINSRGVMVYLKARICLKLKVNCFLQWLLVAHMM